MVRFERETAILAHGAFPRHAAPLAALRAAVRVICCDGAADALERAGMRDPDWVVGDLDSLSDAARIRLAGRLAHVAEQETCDLSKAFRFCLERGWRSLVALGATGGREDHTLANLSLLADFAREADIVLLTDTGWFTPVLDTARLASAAGQPVSLVAFDPRAVAHARGLKYPVAGLRLDTWWRATLNEALGDTIDLAVSHGPLLVYQAYGT